MVVMILEKVPASLRGELTRWMIEPRTGVFIGHLSARVRDLLWEKCCNGSQTGGVVQAWSTNTEQHFALRMAGDTSRLVVDVEGLQLIMVPGESEKAARIRKTAVK
jgi:CRISPR-associated protein Cas2